MRKTAEYRTVHPVSDIMTERVSTLGLDDRIATARRLLERERFHRAVVLEHQKVVGVISDRDILRAISPFAGHRLMERSQDAETLKLRVHQIMIRAVVSVGPDKPIAVAAALMLRKGVSCLPVVGDDGRLVGILTTRDLLAWCVEVANAAVRPSTP